MKANFNDVVMFRLDGRVEGIGIVTEVHSHSYHVLLTEPCKEFDAGVIIIVSANEIYEVSAVVEETGSSDDDTNKCHCCSVHTDDVCSFDVEMNPYSNPRPCCGSHGCAEDV